tara:strand:- start:554 stop:730 length:177 start_codon:yes stop_codon:yes gene_type:complete
MALYDKIEHETEEEKIAFENYIKAKRGYSGYRENHWMDPYLKWLHIRNKHYDRKETKR